MSAVRHMYLLLRLDGPLMAWGEVTFDPRRPTQRFPTRSALAGLLANALGWRYRDGHLTTALQDSLWYGVRRDREGEVLEDYQTVDLARETEGWTRWGIEKRGGGSAKDTHILNRHYLAGASFVVALRLLDTPPVELSDVESALRHPARPLHLGRKSCPPATPLLQGSVQAETLLDALTALPLSDSFSNPQPEMITCWVPTDEARSRVGGAEVERVEEVWDRRDFVTDMFAGARSVAEIRVARSEFESKEAEP